MVGTLVGHCCVQGKVVMADDVAQEPIFNAELEEVCGQRDGT